MNDQLHNLWHNNIEDLLEIGHKIALTVLILILVRIFSNILQKSAKHLSTHYPDIDLMSVQMLTKIITYALYMIGGIIILDLMGINTTSIIAMLGAAGITVGLALKDTLSNIASGFMLLILRPFKIGDSIECGGIKGTVQEIGLFNCILRDPEDLYISAPNRSLWDKPIKNFTRK